MDIRQQKFIPESVARRALKITASQWKELVASRVVDLAVKRTPRGAEVKTDIESIERASRVAG